ncbi:MAG TPA: hypothetical protein VF194_12190 [Ferrovibrio sp.]|jgi:hypothetical protein|uniref:hypothetical protein n=1 Tax=Ferrovibrio sp. TaxID=1917215 RepID=UPI002ED1B27C
MTRMEVISILGPADDTVVSEIVSAGATVAELAEAFAWLQADDAFAGSGRPPPHGMVAELIDIITPKYEDER